MKTPIAAALAVALALVGCKSTEKEMHALTDSWKRPTTHGTYETMMVMALTEDHTQRVALETAVAKDLEMHGHKTVLGYKSWKGPKMFDDKSFMEFCKNYGVDAVLTIATQEDVVGIQSTDVAVMANANLTQVVEASMTTTDVADDFIVDVVVWDAKSWDPVWAGRSETIEQFHLGPGGVDEFVTRAVTVDAKL